jgi:hypothetical protein
MLHNISRINIDAFYYIKETEIYQPTRPQQKEPQPLRELERCQEPLSQSLLGKLGLLLVSSRRGFNITGHLHDQRGWLIFGMPLQNDMLF